MLGTGTITVAPRMLILMLASVASLLLFRYIDKRFHADGIGTIARTIHGAWGNAAQRARAQYDAARDRVDQAQSHQRIVYATASAAPAPRRRRRRRGRRVDVAHTEFDTFKPRPAQPRPTSSSGQPAAPTGPAAQTAARTGATQAADATATAVHTSRRRNGRRRRRRSRRP